jgi:hypothetical protein
MANERNITAEISKKETLINTYTRRYKILIGAGVVVAVIAVICFFGHYWWNGEQKEEPIKPLAFEFVNSADTSKLSLDATQLKTLQEVMKDNGDKNAIDYMSAFGDFMAGTALGLWSLGGLLLVYVSFLGQQIGLLQAEQQIKETNKDIQDTKKTVEDQTKALQGMMTALNIQNSKINAQTTVLVNQKIAMEAMAEALKIQNEKTENQTNVLSGQTNVLKTQKEAMDKMATALEMQIEKIQGQTDVLSGQTGVLEAQKEALLASAKELTKHSDELYTQSIEMVEQKDNFVLQMVTNQFNNYVKKLDLFKFTGKKELFNTHEIKSYFSEDVELSSSIPVALAYGEDEELIGLLLEGYWTFLDRNNFIYNILDYFKYLNFILSYIDSAQIDIIPKKHFINDLMSRISTIELILWYFETLKNPELKYYIKKYALFKNIDWRLLFIILNIDVVSNDKKVLQNFEFRFNSPSFSFFKEIIGFEAFGEEAPPETSTTEESV